MISTGLATEIPPEILAELDAALDTVVRWVRDTAPADPTDPEGLFGPHLNAMSVALTALSHGSSFAPTHPTFTTADLRFMAAATFMGTLMANEWTTRDAAIERVQKALGMAFHVAEAHADMLAEQSLKPTTETQGTA